MPRLRELEAEVGELEEVKGMYVKQLIDFISDMEGQRQDMVWRSLAGAAQAFSGADPT